MNVLLFLLQTEKALRHLCISVLQKRREEAKERRRILMNRFEEEKEKN